MVLKPELADQLFGDYSVYRRPNIMAQTNVLAVSAASEALKDEDFYKFSLNKANEEKDRIVGSAQSEIEKEVVNAKKSLEKDFATNVMAAAKKIISKEISSSNHEETINKSLEDFRK